MRILIACQYFPPEITAGAMRVHAFAAGLTSRGHEVEVISEVPSHPAGVVAEGYGGKLVDRREMDGFEVSYVWVRATPSKRARARLVNYASYAASASMAGFFRKRADVILASSPPLPVGSVGRLLARRHRVPWVLDVRDLWPDAAVALGEVEEGRLLRMSQRLEGRLYRAAAAITTTTAPFQEAIEGRGGAGKVTVIPNGTTAEFLQIGKEAPQRGLLGAEEVAGGGDVFTWTHAGNIGLFHGLETAVQAAGELGEGFRLLLLGQGTRRAAMEDLASSLPNANVIFMDAVPPGEAARVMRASDALLVSLGQFPGLEGMVLSKLYDSCAVGRPVVVAAPGETHRVAEEAGAALCVSPGDPGELAAAVRKLRDDPSLRDRIAKGARAFAEASSRERGAESLEQVLTGVTEGK